MTETFSCRWFDAVPFNLGAASSFTALPLSKSLDEVFFYIDEDAVVSNVLRIKELLNDLEALRDDAWKKVMNDITGEAVSSFLSTHRDDTDVLEKNMDAKSALNRLGLRGVGVHADENHRFTINIDFGFPRDVSDELLVAMYDAERTFLRLAHES